MNTLEEKGFLSRRMILTRRRISFCMKSRLRYRLVMHIEQSSIKYRHERVHMAWTVPIPQFKRLSLLYEHRSFNNHFFCWRIYTFIIATITKNISWNNSLFQSICFCFIPNVSKHISLGILLHFICIMRKVFQVHPEKYK